MVTALDIQAGAWFLNDTDLLARPQRSATAIDPYLAYEIDDAISVEQLSQHDFAVGIHIANGGLLLYTPYIDQARHKGWSRYSSDGTDPMLPEAIGKGLLSLDRGGEDGAPSISVEFSYSSTSRSIGEVTVSQTRLTCEAIAYEALAKRISRKDPTAKAIQSVGSMLNRSDGGQNYYSGQDMPAKLVAQFMITANCLLAKKMQSEGLPWLFRNHGESIYANLHNLSKKERIMRDFQIAQYGSVALFHEGLGLDQYCHFTSPLRRFADLANHATLHAFMNGLPLPYTEQDLNDIADELTKKYMEQSRHFRNIVN